MRISEVHIKKFRSIKDGKIRLGDISAIVGENNAGKTAILRAVNGIFNFEVEETSFLNKTHQHTKRSNSYITVVFDDIPNESVELQKHINNGTITIEFMYSYGENKRKLSIIKGTSKYNIPNIDLLICELNKYINYVYISSERTNNDICWGNDTIFKKLLTEYINKHTKNRDNISSDIKKSSKKIKDNVLIKLEKNISELYMQNVNVNFKLDFPPNIDYTSILHLVEMSINESESSYLLQEWGSGTKSLAIIAMHRALALIENKSIILGIEEPETNLHPQAQKRFIQSLKAGMYDNEVQTIFTTHSTVLIDELDHGDIILVRRKKDNQRSFVSSVKQISDDFFVKNRINISGHNNFFKIKNSDFFFAKHVIICESPVDIYVIEKLISSELQNNIADISFVDLGGVSNLNYPYFLMKELSIPFSVVVDYDYFFDYKNDELDVSRNSRGFPEYKNTVTTQSNKRLVLEDAFKKDLSKLENRYGYRDFFSITKKQRFYSLMYCLEMDLICSSAACAEYYRVLNVREEDKTPWHLLVECKKTIKKRENILQVMNSLDNRHYPESLKKIKNALIEDIKNL